MFQPLTCAPETDQGAGRKGGEGLEQTPTTFPVTEPVELPPPLTLPFDHTSPTRLAVPLPPNAGEFVHDGLRVWTAAPLVPGLRASDVAVAPRPTIGAAPSTCITVVPIWWVEVAVNVTPAIEWSAEVIVSTLAAGSPNGQVSIAPDIAQAGTLYRRRLRANRSRPA